MSKTSRYGKGSWIYKLLIVALTATLVASIYYPKTLWENEARNIDICRDRLNDVFNASLFYQHFNADFSDSLDLLIEFVRNDSAYHAYIDSVVVIPLERYINEVDTLRQEQEAFEATFTSIDPADSTALDTLAFKIETIVLKNRLFRDKLDALREEMKRHPNFPLHIYDRALDIIERKDFFNQYKIINNMIVQNRPQEAISASRDILADYNTIIESLSETKAEIPGMYALADSMQACPTRRIPYNLLIALVDSTNSVKEVSVQCPIDSVYIDSVNADFMLSTVGALEIKNHGKIKGGEKSWEEDK